MSTDLPPTLGFVAADWIEANTVRGPGDIQGQPVTLTDEAVKFLLDVYELDPVTGRRRYKRAMLVRPKGWSKSELAAFIGLFEAFGPARFDYWDEDGQPVGKPVQTPILRIVATEESQAGNIYDTILYNCQHGPLTGVDAGLTRIVLPDGGSIRPVTAGAISKDGGKETWIAFDELHLFTLPELHRLHQTYIRNLRKRTGSDPWSLETTTAYRPGEGSVAETAMGYAQKIVSGEALDSGFLYDHTSADGSFDLDDRVQREAAVRQAYGDCDWVDFAQIVADWDDPTTDRVDWQRYFTSRVVAGSDAWLDPTDWAACADATKVVADGDTIALGFDGSLYDDSTVLMGCRLEDGHLFPVAMWEKPRNVAAWEVPVGEVDAAFAHAFDTYNVALALCDRKWWESSVDGWATRWPGKVRDAKAQAVKPVADALDRLKTDVLTRKMTHDGDSRVAAHVGNARVLERSGRTLIRKEHPKGQKKIDAAMACAFAYEARALAAAAGYGRQRRVWSF